MRAAKTPWLWLEREAGLPLSAAMADLLAAGLPSGPGDSPR
jgi:hypothetical protein